MSLFSATRAIRDVLDGFDARLLSGNDAAAAAEELARTEKVCAAARLRAQARAVECGAHRDAGFANPSEWSARQSGTTSGEARGELDLAASLDDLPETRAALDDGELSLREACEIARTEKDCPGSEPDMIQTAKKRGLRGVREEGRRRRQAAQNPEELAKRRRNARELRSWTDELGMVCGRFRLEPQHGEPFLARLNAEIDRMWRDGDPEYRSEPREARAADALVRLLQGTGKSAAGRTDLVVVWNLNTDRAHIPGAGPISHETLRDVAKQAVVTALSHDGTDVKRFVRYGRYLPAALRTLLEIGPPPHFDGLRCLDCGRRYHLQHDHLNPLANGGETSYHNIGPRCPECHEAKTERDRQAGLLDNRHPPREHEPKTRTSGPRAPPRDRVGR